MNEERPTAPFYRTRRFKFVLLGCVLVGLLVVAGMLKEIFTPILIAFLLAYVLEPVIAWMERRRIRRGLGVGLVYFVLFCLVAGAVMFVGPPLVRQTGRLYQYISQAAQRYGLDRRIDAPGEMGAVPDDGGLPPFLTPADDVPEAKPAPAQDVGEPLPGPAPDAERGAVTRWSTLVEEIEAQVRANAGRLAAWITNLFFTMFVRVARGLSNLASFVFSLLLTLIFGCFFMLHFPGIIRTVRRYLPSGQREQIIDICRRIDDAVASFFRGRLLVCVISAFVTSLGLWLSRIDFWLLLGLVAGFLGFIPFIGVTLALIPACAFALLNDPPWLGLAGVGITFAVVQWLVEPLAGTIIFSREVKLHPGTIILALLVGGRLFGMFGLIVSVPFAAIVKILAQEFLVPPLRELADGQENGGPRSSRSPG